MLDDRDRRTNDTAGGTAGGTPALSWEQFIGALEATQRQLKGMLAELGRLSRSGAKGDPFQVARWVETLLSALEISNLKNACGELAVQLKERAAEAVMRLDADLRDECGRRGWRLDGQWPRYYVERVIRIDVDDASGRATVGESIVPTLVISTMSAAIESEIRDLLPKGFQAVQFLGSLAEAYDHLATAQLPAVPIWLVYREVLLAQQPKAFWRSGRSDAFRNYSEQRFRASLTKLLEEGITRTADDRELKLLPALKPDDGMYLYEPLEQRFAFVGRVEFTKRGDERHE